MRHFDFQRIYDEFVNYYHDQSKGDSEYYSWVRALGVDESKPYGQARESFKWAKSMLNFLKEDAENKYYGVIVGLPWRSMNGNVYRERDLIAAALSLKGKHPSLNHKDEFWFKPGNPWGTLTVDDAKYEDGAVEAILKVPKTAVCPICNGAKMTSLIDEQHIVNVSLEGTDPKVAFEFTDPPFTLLTSDVLPGIPLARIKPLEKIMVEALQTASQNKTGEKRMDKIKIVATVKEDSHMLVNEPKPDVKTDTLTSTEPLTTINTPIAHANQIRDPSELASAVIGINAAGEGTIMKSAIPQGDVFKMPSNTANECSCPKGEHMQDGICMPNGESAEADYPWDQCIADQMKKYGDEATAKKVCGAIRGGSVHRQQFTGLTKQEALALIAKEENAPDRGVDAPTTGPTADTSMPKPEDIRSGPPRSKAPDRGTPQGSLPHTPRA